ncbi:sensor histidine kinase, partial [Streptomyces sp. 13-12-16]|uniref:sensor histidine kinase n=1 Tax=Streptomyces sp. 13-12-16 TaxID=1570823 RepID=UPI00277D1120
AGRTRRRLAVGAATALAAGCCGAWAYGRTGAAWSDVLRDLAVGWAYAGAGLLAWWRRPANRTGPLMLAEGLTWFLGNLQGTTVPVLFALGAWTEALNLAVLAHLLLAYPEGRTTTSADRRVVLAGYLLVGVGGLLRALVYDPAVSGTASYLDCRGCGPNALLVHSDAGLFTLVDLGYRWLGAALTLVCAYRLVRRWRAGGPARRRALMPAWIAVVVAVAFIGWEMLHLVAPDALAPAATVLALPSDLSQIAVPFAFLAGLLRLRLRRAAVADLVTEAAADPGLLRLQEALARTLGDPSVRLGVRTADTSTVSAAGPADPAPAAPPRDPRTLLDDYTDPYGRPLPQAAGLSVTPLGDEGPDGFPAVLLHDPALDDEPELLAAAGAAVRLCLRASRLRAEVRVREQGTAEVRARLLRAADDQRRRLERNLHDGAQTRLVLALMALRRAGVRTGADGADGKGREDGRTAEEAALRRAVADAEETLRQAVEDLRDLAQGIHPALLTREGVGPAVTALAERSALPVRVTADPGRYPPFVESAAYFTVCEAVSNAVKHARAERVEVSVRREGALLVVEVTDDGTGGADPAKGTGLSLLADRLAAAGGVLRICGGPHGGTRVRAELPCA